MVLDLIEGIIKIVVVMSAVDWWESGELGLVCVSWMRGCAGG
jgi:hypothetical protein